MDAATPEARAGQHLMAGFEGVAAPASLIERVRAGRIGGVILFKRNIESAAQTAALIASLQVAALASPLEAPLLVGIDQEGGRVSRLSPDFTIFPAARGFGDFRRSRPYARSRPNHRRGTRGGRRERELRTRRGHLDEPRVRRHRRPRIWNNSRGRHKHGRGRNRRTSGGGRGRVRQAFPRHRGDGPRPPQRATDLPPHARRPESARAYALSAPHPPRTSRLRHGGPRGLSRDRRRCAREPLTRYFFKRFCAENSDSEASPSPTIWTWAQLKTPARGRS